MHTYTIMCSFADSGSPPVRGKFELSSLFFPAWSSRSSFCFIELRGYFFIFTRVSSCLLTSDRCSWLCFLLINLHTFFSPIFSPQIWGVFSFSKKIIYWIMHYFRPHSLRLQFSVLTVISILVVFFFGFILLVFFALGDFFIYTSFSVFRFTFWGKSII